MAKLYEVTPDEAPMSDEAKQRWVAFMSLPLHTRILRLNWLLNMKGKAILVAVFAEHHLRVGGIGEGYATKLTKHEIVTRSGPLMNRENYKAAFFGLEENEKLLVRAPYKRYMSRQRHWLDWVALDQRLCTINWDEVDAYLPYAWLVRSRVSLTVLLQAIEHGDQLKQAAAPKIQERWSFVPGLVADAVFFKTTGAIQSLHKSGLIELGPDGFTYSKSVHSFRATPLVQELVDEFMHVDFAKIVAP